ncbi:adenylate/guanylate cyclase domain-containing protein [Usitatibacter palustris]|uniref:Guanylate cyclase domain-containing protein n=1 Tax=Usitatibacter palustris TaxID=2732487 RepID=A0A6M4HD05_9PROT|nr:adenylate/guanylate cyclase domain-containing protein [Usitatibacter palustris]QJR16955.1 hypothetical protein DSM104440_03792 [Usitatibacter palustris]
MRGFALAALALVGLAFAWTPVSERIDLAILDAETSFLRKFAPRPAPNDIIVIGVDDASFKLIPEPLGLWHEPLARVLVKVAGAKPRAIGLDVTLPDRSGEAMRPGLDRVLMTGLVAAKQNGPVVVSLTVDSRTRAAKPIHTPFLAVLREEGLGLGLLARDADGVVRRFSLSMPTDDSSFPTLVGRLCRAVSKTCDDGYIDFALGQPFRYVPFHEVLHSTDPTYLEKLFKGRIVLVGETQRFTDRIDVPVNLAGWEPASRSSPGVVAHAAALRTALHGNPAQDAGRPLLLVMVTVCALLLLVRDWRIGLASLVLAVIALAAGGTLALRSGLVLEIAPALFTLALAWASRTAYEAWSERRERQRLRTAFAGYVSPGVLRAILKGQITPGHKGERRDLAFIFADLRGSTAMTAQTTPEEAVALLNRFHEVISRAIHRHDGMLDNIRGDGVMAVFGAPKALADPAASAWAAAQDMFRGLERLNSDLAREGRPPLAMGVGLAAGPAVIGHVGARDRFNYTAIGDATNVAAKLQGEAKRLGMRVVTAVRFEEEGVEPLGPIAIDGHEAVEAWGWR